jgi:hypothetical protein
MIPSIAGGLRSPFGEVSLAHRGCKKDWGCEARCLGCWWSPEEGNMVKACRQTLLGLELAWPFEVAEMRRVGRAREPSRRESYPGL